MLASYFWVEVKESIFGIRVDFFTNDSTIEVFTSGLFSFFPIDFVSAFVSGFVSGLFSFVDSGFKSGFTNFLALLKGLLFTRLF